MHSDNCAQEDAVAVADGAAAGHKSSRGGVLGGDDHLCFVDILAAKRPVERDLLHRQRGHPIGPVEIVVLCPLPSWDWGDG